MVRSGQFPFDVDCTNTIARPQGAQKALKNMALCETQLWDIVRSIEPTLAQKEGASRSQNYLRDTLNTGQMASRIVTIYLSGSYSRDTAISPIDDVDIIVVIDPSYWNTAGNIVSSILFGPPFSFPPPAAVLQTFANAIRYRYPVSSVFGQRRSVRLQLNHLDIDVVPAIEDKNDAAVIKIPDTGAEKWIPTSPKRHSENATTVNKFQNGKFKPLVKLLKYWNGNLPSTAKFKSFAIETMAVRAFGTQKFTSLQDGLLQFFDFVAFVSGNKAELTWADKSGVSLGWLSCSIPDAAETGSNTAAGVDEERKKRFINGALRSRIKMVESFKALSVDTAFRKVSEALKI
jgi:SMODS domain-containing protein